MQRPLRDMISATALLANLMAPLVVPPESTEVAAIPIPCLDLVSPPNLRHRLEGLGLCSDIVSNVAQAVDKAIATIKSHYVETYEATCRSLFATQCPSSSPLPELFQKLRNTYQAIYERHILSWIDARLPAFLTTHHFTSPSHQPLPVKKAPFRHVSITSMVTNLFDGPTFTGIRPSVRENLHA